MVATPAMPNMSADQVAAVQGDWAKLKGQGVEIFFFFLNKYPSNYEQFKAFAGKDLAAAKGTPEFADQAKKIADLLTSVIDKLGSDVAGAKAILNKMAEGHKNMGITKEQFESFRTATIELLGNLGHGSNIAAWQSTFDMIFHVIFNQYDGKPV